MPTATLAEVDIRSELSSRPPRLPDSEGLDQALAGLAEEMAENPRNMLQRLVETAVESVPGRIRPVSACSKVTCSAREAVARASRLYRDGTMPRTASPCGVCIDENVTQLMHLAGSSLLPRPARGAAASWRLC